MDKPSKNHKFSLSTGAQIMAGDAKAQALTYTVKNVRLALVNEPLTDTINVDAQTKKHLHHPNRWAAETGEIKIHYNRWMDEGVHMHECAAMSNWENR